MHAVWIIEEAKSKENDGTRSSIGIVKGLVSIDAYQQKVSFECFDEWFSSKTREHARAKVR